MDVQLKRKVPSVIGVDMLNNKRQVFREPGVSENLIEEIRARSRPLRGVADLNPLLRRIGSARFALLGEGTHGTSEFHEWRIALTKRLIEESGFCFVAVEGSWPDCKPFDAYVRGRPVAGSNAREVARAALHRWPSWLLANEEIIDFIEWLRSYNARLPPERKIGFYGIDVFSLWNSLGVFARYLRERHPQDLPILREVVRRYDKFGADSTEYAKAHTLGSVSCREAMGTLLQQLHLRYEESLGGGEDRELDFELALNAIVLKNAESYYEALLHAGPDSWNIRERHMHEILERLLVHHGEGAKALVWEHNSHVGDARYTDMAAAGEVNLGQLIREAHGEAQTFLMGFSTYEGTVVAGPEWDAPARVMSLPAGRIGSWEDALHRAGADDKLLTFRSGDHATELAELRGHRAVGVVYRPQFDHFSNYVPSVLPKRYDALMYLDRTHALAPVQTEIFASHDVAETYPSGQ